MTFEIHQAAPHSSPAWAYPVEGGLLLLFPLLAALALGAAGRGSLGRAPQRTPAVNRSNGDRMRSRKVGWDCRRATGTRN
jgi:hypothetical protein